MAKSLGRAVAQARERLNVTPAALARAALIDPGELARIESGERVNPSFAIVCRIAAALGMSSDELAIRSGLRKGKVSKLQTERSMAGALAGLDAIESSLRRALAGAENVRKRLRRDT